MNLIASVVRVDQKGKIHRDGPILLFRSGQEWKSEDGKIVVDGTGLFNDTAAGWKRGLNKMMLPMSTDSKRLFVCKEEAEYHSFMTGFQIGAYVIGLALENQKRILP